MVDALGIESVAVGVEIDSEVTLDFELGVIKSKWCRSEAGLAKAQPNGSSICAWIMRIVEEARARRRR